MGQWPVRFPVVIRLLDAYSLAVTVASVIAYWTTNMMIQIRLFAAGVATFPAVGWTSLRHLELGYGKADW